MVVTRNQSTTLAAMRMAASEEISAPAVVGGNPVPVLETGKAVLDPVALPAESPVMVRRVSALTPHRDAGSNLLDPPREILTRELDTIRKTKRRNGSRFT